MKKKKYFRKLKYNKVKTYNKNTITKYKNYVYYVLCNASL